jgi:divalent metal cation (Fe/Co/Zn/Cd) transporter
MIPPETWGRASPAASIWPVSRRRRLPGIGWAAATRRGQPVSVEVRDLAAESDRGRRQRIALGLAWATIAWNTVEAVVATVSGVIASSIALVGFGLDSTVEVLSASVIVWQMTRDVPEDREEQALRLIAASFFALAGYVTVQAAFDLASRSEPDTSTVGIALAAVSLVVMPVLAGLKRRNGRRLGSGSVVADSSQTLLCTYLSAVLLVGLLLNATVGWWWADPVAALMIAALAIHEGREAWHGERCCHDACAA